MHHKNVFEDIFQKLILAYAIRHGETPNYFYTSYKIMSMAGWDIEVVDGKFRDIKILYTKKDGLAVSMEEVSVDKIDEDLIQLEFETDKEGHMVVVIPPGEEGPLPHILVKQDGKVSSRVA